MHSKRININKRNHILVTEVPLLRVTYKDLSRKITVVSHEINYGESKLMLNAIAYKNFLCLATGNRIKTVAKVFVLLNCFHQIFLMVEYSIVKYWLSNIGCIAFAQLLLKGKHHF